MHTQGWRYRNKVLLRRQERRPARRQERLLKLRHPWVTNQADDPRHELSIGGNRHDTEQRGQNAARGRPGGIDHGDR